MAKGPSERDVLRAALERGKECLSVEMLERCLDAAAPAEFARHLESCTYCSTELELMRSFLRGPGTEEAEAVRAIAERMSMPRTIMPAAAGPWWRRFVQVRWVTGAAVALAGVLIAFAVGLQWRRGTAPQFMGPNQAETEIMRSATIAVIAPVGDLEAVPAEIQWQPVANADHYQVQVLEVDRTAIWSATTRVARVEIPSSVRARIVPNKTLLIEVAAFGADKHRLATSEAVRFRLLQKVYSH